MFHSYVKLPKVCEIAEQLLGCHTVPSGNDCYIAMENVPVEIVDLPIQHGEIP